MDEIWKFWDEHFEISNMGSVRVGTKSITLRSNGRGYFRFMTRNRKDVSIHRAVAKLFVSGETIERNEVAHTNGKSSDNRASNLKWATRKENEHDKKGHGTVARGESHGATYLKPYHILGIRQEWELGYGSQVLIAKRYGTSRSLVGRVVRNEAWND